MDIEINAHGRYVKVTDIEGELDDAINSVYSLWVSTEDGPVEEEKLGSTGFSAALEQSDQTPIGFVPIGENERPIVR